jgi:Fe-S-cluster-containing hydrogenase component 2
MPGSGNPRNSGYLSVEILKNKIRLPSKQRWASGPAAIIECTEDIPCDPCVDSCPSGAIHMNSLTAPPTVDFQACTGCTLCMDICPGLAIFVVDVSGADQAIVSIPYEMLPLPQKGQSVEALDRRGRGCSLQIMRLISRTTGKPMDKIIPFTSRPPLAPLPLGLWMKINE